MHLMKGTSLGGGLLFFVILVYVFVCIFCSEVYCWNEMIRVNNVLCTENDLAEY